MPYSSGAEPEIFPSCLVVGALVNKLNEAMQQRWFCCRVLSPRQAKSEGFDDWFQKETKAAIWHLSSVLAAKFSKEQPAGWVGKPKFFAQGAQHEAWNYGVKIR